MNEIIRLVATVFWIVGALICIFAVLALLIPSLVAGGADRFLLLAGVLFLGALSARGFATPVAT